PFLVLWLPFLLFAGFTTWLFHMSNGKPGADPLAHIFDGLSDALLWSAATAKRLVQRSKSEAAG
ncbi:MAG: hypothetical protein ACK4ZS_04610, partial [Sulfurimicrobium sp.]